jgi:transposase
MSPNVTDSPENRMDVHENARLTPRGREGMVRAVVDYGATSAEAARRFNISAKTVAKWVRRFRVDGVAGLRDRSSRPLSSPSQTELATCDAVEALRRQRRTQAAIAAQTGLSPATVSRILKRRGLSLLSAIEPAALRARNAGRDHSSGHQEARQVQRRRTPHYRQPDRPVQPALGSRRARMGIRPCCHRRPFPPRLQPSQARRKASQRRRIPGSRGPPLQQPWRDGCSPHDRQWQLL